MRHVPPRVRSLALASLAVLASPAYAQPAEPPEPPSLPAPTLEEPAFPAEPTEEEEPQRPQILYRIRGGEHSEYEDDEGASAPADVPFEVPGDVRTAPAQQLRMPQAEPSTSPPPFSLAVGAGFARLLGVETLDFARIEQRFEARIPGFDALRVGAGASQMFGQGYLVGGGVRLALGAGFCDAGWVRCEGVAFVQPGVLGGDVFGVRFDLHAGLDLRFHFPPLFEIAATGGYSMLNGLSMFHATLQAGVVF